MNNRPPFWPFLVALVMLSVFYTYNPAQAHAAEEQRNDNIILVIDTSGSMDSTEIQAARTAAHRFAANVPADIPVGLVDFDTTTKVLVEPTTDRKALDAGLAKLESGGYTSLYAAVVQAAQAVGRNGSLIILSDGVDSAKTTTLAQAQEAERVQNVQVDAIAFVNGNIPAGLKELVNSRNGVVRAENSAQLSQAFTQTAVEYTVSYGSGRVSAVTVAKPKVPLWVVMVGVFFLLAIATWMLWPRKRPKKIQDDTESNIADSVLQLSERYMAARGQEAKVATGLDRAGLAMKPNEWLVLRICAAVVTVALLAVLSHRLILSIVLGVALSIVGTRLWLRARQNKRAAAFAEQLPDTLQILASSLRSGFSLNQALTAANERGHEPMASELGRALAAARIGSSLEDELDAVAVRMDSEDWKWTVMAIRIQRNVGGNLAEILTTTAKTLRDRAALHRTVRALSAEGRLSAYLLIIMPIGVSAFLIAFRRAYVSLLWTSKPGLVMLLVAAIGMVVGWIWMRKVIEVKV